MPYGGRLVSGQPIVGCRAPGGRRRQAAVVLSCVLLLCVALSNASAQESTASVIGRVVDQSGSVLPGVTITARAPRCRSGRLQSSQIPMASTAWSNCHWASTK